LVVALNNSAHAPFLVMENTISTRSLVMHCCTVCLGKSTSPSAVLVVHCCTVLEVKNTDFTSWWSCVTSTASS
jgi:hypothetical protein